MSSPIPYDATYVDRLGRLRRGATLIHRQGITSVESAPTDEKRCFRDPRAEVVKWTVIPPAGVTSYTIVVGRMEFLHRQGRDARDGVWCEEETVTPFTGVATIDQPFDGHPVDAYISAFVGTIGVGFTIRVQPLGAR